MPQYAYRAMNNRGRQIRGQLSAVSELDLYQQLQGGGLELIHCREARGRRYWIPSFKSIKTRDLVQLTMHLHQLQKAGVPLLDGLDDIRGATDSHQLRDVISEVHRDVVEGASLSNAFAQHPRVFGNVFQSLIAAGEETGNLADSFDQLTNHLKWTDEMTSNMKRSMRYPMMLMVVVVLVVTFMMGFVVPQVVGFLRSSQTALPFSTKSLIFVSDMFKDYWYMIFIAPVLIFSVFKIGNRISESFAFLFDTMILRLPRMGGLLKKMALSRFTHTFAVMFNSGLEILTCLNASTRTVGNKSLEDALNVVRDQVRGGSSLSSAFASSGEFPSLVVRMVKIGEDSGNLGDVLQHVSDFYDRDVDDAVKSLIGMLEPAMTVLLGAVIAWIAVAVFGPIYDTLGQMEL